MPVEPNSIFAHIGDPRLSNAEAKDSRRETATGRLDPDHNGHKW